MEKINFKELVQALKEKLTGELILPEDLNFEINARIWNTAISQRPLMIIMAENTTDVVQAVKFAVKHQLSLSVRGGGHDWAGRSIAKNGILLNMRRMNHVQVYQNEQMAVVGGGVKGIEVSRALEAYGLMAATPTIGEVGLTGWAIGGGYGPVCPSVGLGVDNILSAEIVLADGTVCQVNENENEDLFWAIRGGGGNFGVITSLAIKLYKAKPFISGMILFNASDAQTVLQAHNQLLTTAPNELAVSAGMMHGPDGKDMVYLAPFWFGELSRGEKYIAEMKRFAEPVTADVGPMSYSDMLELQSSFIRNDLRWSIQTRWLHSLNAEQIGIIKEAINSCSSPYSIVNIHHFHGVTSGMKSDLTPFPLRAPHYMIEIVAAWELKDDSEDQIQRQWAATLSENLKAEALPGGYINLLGPDETEQIKHAFGDNLSRLQKIKRKYDFHEFFNGTGISKNKLM